MDRKLNVLAAQAYRPAMVRFLRDMIGLSRPSPAREEVARRIGVQELESLG